MAKFISKDNKQQIRQLLEICKKEKDGIIFTVWDTEEKIIKTADPDKIIDEIDGGDEEIGINCYNKSGFLGWFGVLPYEDEDIIFNHTDNAFCNNVMRRL